LNGAALSEACCAMADWLRMFPLSTVLFPHSILPVHVFEPRYRMMIDECLQEHAPFGVVLITRGSEVGGGDTRVLVGTAAVIESSRRLPDGRLVVSARGSRRLAVTVWRPESPYPNAEIEWLAEPDVPAGLAATLDLALASVRRCRALLSELQDVPGIVSDGPTGLAERCWWLCDQSPFTLIDRQRLLEAHDVDTRLGLLVELTDQVAEDLSRLLASGS
jgi:Lon protease-like protein